MKSSILFIIILLTFYGSLASNVGKLELAQLKQQIDEGITRHGITDRDLHTWWSQFNASYAELDRVMTDKTICEKHDMIGQQIDDLNDLLEKIKMAWELKEEQLGELQTILVHEKYNTTGLAKNAKTESCEGLQHYIDEAKLKHKQEAEWLKEDEGLVNNKMNWWKTHPCPCIWGPWSESSGCSKTCREEGGVAGISCKNRTIIQDAINGGMCEGEPTECQECNDVCCPENCTWNDWSDWTNCPAECVPGGTYQSRYRSKNEHKCGGMPCWGLSTERNKCNPFLYQQEKCNIEITQKEHKIDQLEERIATLEKDLGLCEKKLSWDIQQCYKSNLSDDKKTLLLDSRGKWPADHFCRAIHKLAKIDNGNSYEMTVTFDNLTPTNYGHVGFVYNVKDDKNYEYVYKRLHAINFAYGAIKDGQFANGGSNYYINVGHAGPKIYSGKFYQLKIQVSADKKVKLFMDGKQLGGYNAFSPTWGHGGVTIANGFNNTAKFRNFQLIPI